MPVRPSPVTTGGSRSAMPGHWGAGPGSLDLEGAALPEAASFGVIGSGPSRPAWATPRPRGGPWPKLATGNGFCTRLVIVPIHWGTLAVAWRRPGEAPAEEFWRLAAERAPDVGVRVLPPGGSTLF
jgi:hypothetical protein